MIRRTRLLLATVLVAATTVAAPAANATVPPGDGEPNCTYLPRFAPSSDTIGDWHEVHPIYFMASDTVTMNYDLARLCDNGAKTESSIGYAMHNVRKWMSSQMSSPNPTPGGQLMNGKAFKVATRTDTAYGITTSSYRVMAVRGEENSAYYQQSGMRAGGYAEVLARIASELRRRGFNKPRVRYLIFAQLKSPDTGVMGWAEPLTSTTGNMSMIFVKYVRTGETTTRPIQWGCATEGDMAAGHELMHTFDIPHEIYSTHSSDIMYKNARSTFRGYDHDGAQSPHETTVWDVGDDNYSTYLLNDWGAYIGNGPISPLHYCPFV